MLPLHRLGLLRPRRPRGPGRQSSCGREERGARDRADAGPAAAAAAGASRSSRGAFPRWLQDGLPDGCSRRCCRCPGAGGRLRLGCARQGIRKQLAGGTYVKVIHGWRGAFLCHLLQHLDGKQTAGSPNAWCPPIQHTHTMCPRILRLVAQLTSAYCSTMALSTSSSPSQSRQLSKSTESQAGCGHKEHPLRWGSRTAETHSPEAAPAQARGLVRMGRDRKQECPFACRQ